MLRKIEHIGIAVRDIDAAEKIFSDILGTKSYKREVVESEHVLTSFFQMGKSKIELLQATHPDSAIARYLEKGKEGIHHIAFEVEDIYAEIERLKGLGYTMILDVPKEGADNKLIAFLHPKGSNGVLVELCMEKS
ncbi:MAG: methylmalonyl-CoA epimerase [Flavobacteriales bacterium]